MDAIYTKEMDPNTSEAVKALDYDQLMGINGSNTNSMWTLITGPTTP